MSNARPLNRMKTMTDEAVGGWITRRRFLKTVTAACGALCLGDRLLAEAMPNKMDSSSIRATVYRATAGSPDKNVTKVVEMMGGINKLIGSEDAILIKPNVQWWNQGAPNLLALAALVETVMERPGGFRGEVVVAENCHRGPSPWTSQGSGWARVFERNSDVAGIGDLNALCAELKKRYGRRFSVCHWIDVANGAKKVSGPKDGPGYVYCDGTDGNPLIACDNGRSGGDHRATLMTYPVFATDSGTIVDFKNGIWSRGTYTGQPLRFINMAALNHHSTYCGMTSSVKNYMGITDLSGGPDPANGGSLDGKYFNFHAFPFNKWAPGPAPGMLGKAIGAFMKTVRKADLNITTAEWVGLSSRTDPPVARTRAVLASVDPVALDSHAAKYLLYPNSGLSIHRPDDPKGPVYAYLKECAETAGFTLDEKKVQVVSYDFKTRKVQEGPGSPVMGEMRWGTNPKGLLKYLYLRMGRG